MNIALVLDRFYPRHGGLEYWTYQLANWLAENGHVVHIVAFDFCRDIQDIPVVPHPVQARQNENPLKRAWRLAGYLKHMNVDLIHDTGSSWHCDILQPQSGSRIAAFFHQLHNLRPFQAAGELLSISSWRLHFLFRLLERRQFKRAGHVIAVSNFVCKDLQRLYKIDDHSITVIHNGVDVRQFTPESKTEQHENPLALWKTKRANTFLMSANNFRLKGVDNALLALRNLDLDGITAHLAVMGRGPVDKYRQRAQHLGVGDRVFFCGQVNDPENYYTACDVYLHPALYDACSLSVLEAMACGIPVITSRFNGSSEMIDDGEQGLILTEPRNAAELTAAMKRLCNEEFRSLLKSRVRTHVLQFDIEYNFSKIMNLYKSIAVRKAESRART